MYYSYGMLPKYTMCTNEFLLGRVSFVFYVSVNLDGYICWCKIQVCSSDMINKYCFLLQLPSVPPTKAAGYSTLNNSNKQSIKYRNYHPTVALEETNRSTNILLHMRIIELWLHYIGIHPFLRGPQGDLQCSLVPYFILTTSLWSRLVYQSDPGTALIYLAFLCMI